MRFNLIRVSLILFRINRELVATFRELNSLRKMGMFGQGAFRAAVRVRVKGFTYARGKKGY